MNLALDQGQRPGLAQSILVPAWITANDGKNRAQHNQIRRTFPRIGCESLSVVRR